jgi:Ca2+-binding EF-hand superfamily protein
MFLYLLIVLELKPYQNFADDLLSLATTVSMLLIAMCGLLLKLDESAPQGEKNFNPVIMGNALVALTSFTIFCCLLNLVLIKMKVWVLVEKRWGAKGSSVNSTLSRSLSHGMIATAVVHHKAVKIQSSHAEARLDVIAKVEKRRIGAKKRTKLRLAKRRKEKEAKNKEKMKEEESENGNENELTSTSDDVAARLESLRCSMYKAMKIGTKRDKLDKIFAKIDKDKNSYLDREEFARLVQAVLQTNQNIQQEFLDAILNDIRRAASEAESSVRSSSSSGGSGGDLLSASVLREWLTVDGKTIKSRGSDMKKHVCKVVPVTSPAVDQSQEVQAVRQSLFKLMKMDTSKDILSKVFQKIDRDSSNLLNKGEFFKLIHRALKEKPQKLLFDAVWADVSCNDARDVSVAVLREWLTF